MSGTSALRFTPGGYGAPTVPRIRLELGSLSTADSPFVPLISVEAVEES